MAVNEPNEPFPDGGPASRPEARPEPLSREEAIAAQVIEVIAQLVSEVHSSFGTAPAITLQSSLDRDLTLDSLARTELLLRLNRTFEVRLPDRLLGEASTPADLVAAIIHAAPRLKKPLEQMSARRPLGHPWQNPLRRPP